ncbi:MAG TPA: SAM-dependent methyltransferase [Polyangiaceae bacterium]|jgi:predicted methyltransferase|nr:SAM-dependent methyltransferase [Polyangiaceae bacterium]
MTRPVLALATLLFSVAAGCAGSSPPSQTAAAPPPVASTVPTKATEPVATPTASDAMAPDLAPYQAIVGAADRDDADKKLDEGRHPAELLAFIGVKPGMHVAELGAAGGYTSELLARAVGPSGVVYGQNPEWLVKRYAEKPWSERLAKPVMKNVVRVDREFDDPFPKEAHDLDAVTIMLFYHDTVWSKVDRDKMNRAVLAALKPGGVYVVVDTAARKGAGIDETQSLHRIDESVVKDEVLKAGFRLGAEADFLKNPADTHDWNASPKAAGERRGTADRFVLKFVKP